jgi:hypothetical protein
MRKSTYLFEILDEEGAPLRRVSRRCDNIRAHEKAQGLLNATPGAAAVFGFERGGMQVHAAYRD